MYEKAHQGIGDFLWAWDESLFAPDRIGVTDRPNRLFMMVSTVFRIDVLVGAADGGVVTAGGIVAAGRVAAFL